MPEIWKEGIVAYIFKKGQKELKNYRPVVLLTTIYKIWATIIANRIQPLLIILTKDNQCAYRRKDLLWILFTISKTHL